MNVESYETFVDMNFGYDINDFKNGIYSEHMFGNWTKSSYKMKVCVFSYFEPSGLRCKLTVMPLR